MTRETAVATGRRFEAFAADYLKVRGCRIEDQNFRCKAGEIDLIVTDPESRLVFVEVRFRASNRFGGAGASVTAHKQNRIRNAAKIYLLTHREFKAHFCRFDVMALSHNKQTNEIDVNWIKAAFV